MARKRKRNRQFGAISIKTRCPREGMRVVFNPNPVSRMLYSSGYRLPPKGAVGRVMSMPLGRGRATCMRGPGGGLVYVDWGKHGTMGIASYDLDKA